MCQRDQQRITVDEVGEDFSPNAQIAVGVHELAHALVVVDCQEGDPKLRYGQEEVVVECGAFTVCASLGLDTSGSSIPYMTGWSKDDEVGRYGELIDRLARRIEDALLEFEPPKDDRGKGAAVPVLATA